MLLFCYLGPVCLTLLMLILVQMCLLYGGVPGGQGKLEDHLALASAKCQVSILIESNRHVNLLTEPLIVSHMPLQGDQALSKLIIRLAS